MDSVLHKILTDAMDKKASDVSFLPQKNSYLVKFCVAGRFEAYDEFDFERASQWIGFLKYRADMSLAEQRRPQLGSWELEHNGRPVYCRLSTVGDFLNRESLDLSRGIAENKKMLLYRPMGPTVFGVSEKRFDFIVRSDGQRKDDDHV